MNRPWMKFYPADWRADPRLRMCSYAGRGLWADLISYMHEGAPYGHLTIDGMAPDIAGISALTGRPLAETRKAIAELETFQVFSRTDNGVIFSRRMVRDSERAERDKANGRTGGNPSLKGGVNPSDKGGDKAHSIGILSSLLPDSSSSEIQQSSEPRARDALIELEAEFTVWYRAYPTKIGRGAARKAFVRVRRAGIALAALLDGLERYKQSKPADIAWCYPATWLNQQRWLDEPAPNGGIKHGPHGVGTGKSERQDRWQRAYDQLSESVAADERGEEGSPTYPRLLSNN